MNTFIQRLKGYLHGILVRCRHPLNTRIVKGINNTIKVIKQRAYGYPDVLTVHPDYFLIDPGIGRFVYRLARRAAGTTIAKWSFKTIYERSGSAGTLKKFTENLRKIIATNSLPEYTLSEEAGQIGPLLVMCNRTCIECVNNAVK